MSSQSFRFKQFEVYHNLCAMKVGTDGVLLGAWVAQHYADSEVKHILDIGTGSGLIALMLAQEFSRAEITGIDIDSSAIEQASYNFRQSPWSDRIKAKQQDCRSYVPLQKFDIVVSNPPYFSQSLKNPDYKRALARHNDNLPYEDLVSHTMKNLLSDNGRFAIIVPYEQSCTIADLASDYGINDILNIRTAPNKEYKRSIISISRHKGCATIVSDITLETCDHKRSPEYQQLTQGYYL